MLRADRLVKKGLVLGIICMLLGFPVAAAEPAPALVRTSAPSLARPHDLTLDPAGQYLYVADLNNDSVKVMDPESLEVLGSIGEGELNSPHDVAFAEPGRLLVADSGNDRIAIYRVDGARAWYQGELRGGFGSPEGVAVAGPNTVYVTSVGFHNVVRFGDGRKTAAVGDAGRGAGEFLRPHDIELGPDGTLYVGDPGNNRVQLLTQDLSVVATLGGEDYAFREPKYLALDERGWLYVADQHNDQIKIFDRSHTLVATIGGNSGGAADVQLNRPEGVEVHGGKIWIADTYNDRILLFEWRRAAE